jgi:hypothetical protein
MKTWNWCLLMPIDAHWCLSRFSCRRFLYLPLGCPCNKNCLQLKILSPLILLRVYFQYSMQSNWDLFYQYDYPDIVILRRWIWIIWIISKFEFLNIQIFTTVNVIFSIQNIFNAQKVKGESYAFPSSLRQFNWCNMSLNHLLNFIRNRRYLSEQSSSSNSVIVIRNSEFLPSFILYLQLKLNLKLN